MTSGRHPASIRGPEPALLDAARVGADDAGQALAVLADYLQSERHPLGWALARGLADRELRPLGVERARSGADVVVFRFAPFADALGLEDTETAPDVEFVLLPSLHRTSPFEPSLVARTPLSRRVRLGLDGGPAAAEGDPLTPDQPAVTSSIHEVRRLLLLLRLGPPDHGLWRAAVDVGSLLGLGGWELIASRRRSTAGSLDAVGGRIDPLGPEPDTATRVASAVLRPMRRLPADDILLDSIGDNSASNRLLATEVFGDLGERAIAVLEVALGSPHDSVRTAAFDRLTQLEAGRALLARIAAEHDDPDLRREAARRLGA